MRMALGRICFAITLLLFSLLLVASASDDGHKGYNLNPSPDHKQKLETENLLSTMIGIQGLVYCRSGIQLKPLEGAVARITCEAADEYGVEAEPLSILSGATNYKGYFIATLSPWEVKENWKIKDCKAFLELSPSETCNFPSDDNNGVNGAPLAFYRFLPDKKMKLFSVGPFFFSPSQEAKSISNGY